jgi:hypothetical protein
MSNIRTYDGFNPGLIDERNERPLFIALVATVVAWLTMCVVAFA